MIKQKAPTRRGRRTHRVRKNKKSKRFGVKQAPKPTIMSRFKKNARNIALGTGAVVGTGLVLFLGHKYKIHKRLPKINISRLFKRGEKVPTEADDNYQMQRNSLLEQKNQANQSEDKMRVRELERQLQALEREYKNQKSLFSRASKLVDKVNETKSNLQGFYYKLPEPLKQFYDQTQSEITKKATKLLESMMKSDDEINNAEEIIGTDDYKNLPEDEKKTIKDNLQTLKSKRKEQEDIYNELDRLTAVLNEGGLGDEEEREQIAIKIGELEQQLQEMEGKSSSFGKKKRSGFGKKRTTRKALKGGLKKLKRDLKMLKGC